MATKQTYETSIRDLQRQREQLRAELAALRKKIEDAPVVAWEKFGKERALISKEDLQK